jgi:hypothetical protein
MQFGCILDVTGHYRTCFAIKNTAKTNIFDESRHNPAITGHCVFLRHSCVICFIVCLSLHQEVEPSFFDHRLHILGLLARSVVYGSRFDVVVGADLVSASTSINLPLPFGTPLCGLLSIAMLIYLSRDDLQGIVFILMLASATIQIDSHACGSVNHRHRRFRSVLVLTTGTGAY